MKPSLTMHSSSLSRSESAYLQAEQLIRTRRLHGLRFSLQLLLLGMSLLLGLTFVTNGASHQLAIASTAFLLAALAYGLLLRGHYRNASYLLVFILIAGSTAGIYAYGSVRSALTAGFAAAIVTAGMTLNRRALVLAALLSTAALTALTWADVSGWLLTKPDPTVDLRFWLIHILLLAGLAGSVYANHQTVLQAMREQHQELRRREEAEHALRLSEDRFGRIFQSSPAAIIVQAVDGMTVLDTNPAFERLFGYSRDEFLGGTDAALWHEPLQRKAFLRQLDSAERLINLPLEARTKDGRLIHVLLSTEIEGRGPGAIVVTTIMDSTAEIQARQAARQSAELFAKAFNFSPIAMSITRVSDGSFLAANALDERVLGFSAEELLQLTAVSAGVWPDNAERHQFIEELRRRGQVVSREVRMRHKNGHLVDCQLWSVIVNIGGEPCLLNSTINISEQKKRESLLIDVARGLSAETGEAFFRTVVQHLGQALGADLVLVGETTPDRGVMSLAMVQDGQLLPNSRYALEGSPCDVAIHHPDLCVYGDGIQQLFPHDLFLLDSGYQAYIGAALRNADGEPIGIVNAMWRQAQPPSADRDALMQIYASRISAELVRLRGDREIARLHETLEQRVNKRTEQLKATNAELESFGYSVSHDLQSPLRSIEGFSVLLARRLKGRLSEEEERLFDRIRVNVVRMHELINDLLALARVSQGKLVLDQVNLSAMAQQVVAQEQLRDPQRQVLVTIEPGLSARCDRKLARIILENLIGNAWKYSRERVDAQIEFGTLSGREGGRKMLFVRDNGAGFNMAYSGSLFKPFHRLHHESEFEGSGIGLATVHRILERHGGVIRGESAEGDGACFYFSFDPRFGLSSS